MQEPHRIRDLLLWDTKRDVVFCRSLGHGNDAGAVLPQHGEGVEDDTAIIPARHAHSRDRGHLRFDAQCATGSIQNVLKLLLQTIQAVGLITFPQHQIETGRTSAHPSRRR